MSGFIGLALVGALVFGALVLLRLPRLLWSFAGAALFLGAAGYAWQGRPVPSLYATTLCVDEAFPKAAALIFLHQRELGLEHFITHSTPNPRVQQALYKMGSKAETGVVRHFLPAGLGARLLRQPGQIPLPESKRLITNPAEITALVRPYQRADRLEKWITPEYLRWFCSSPARQHHLLGLVDSAGTLSSYLLVTPRRVKGLRAWDVVETFTTQPDAEELHALVAHLAHHPDTLPGGAALLTAASFPSDDFWHRVPAVVRRRQQVCHFFLFPEHLQHVPKHTVMAEGDLGL